MINHQGDFLELIIFTNMPIPSSNPLITIQANQICPNSPSVGIPNAYIIKKYKPIPINPITIIESVVDGFPIIRSILYYSINKLFNINITESVERILTSIMITCHGCGRKVRADSIKIWYRTDDDGDANDKFGKFRISNHKTGWFKPQCHSSGKTFTKYLGAVY